jgi:hypothetical protein
MGVGRLLRRLSGSFQLAEFSDRISKHYAVDRELLGISRLAIRHEKMNEELAVTLFSRCPGSRSDTTRKDY